MDCSDERRLPPIELGRDTPPLFCLFRLVGVGYAMISHRALNACTTIIRQIDLAGFEWLHDRYEYAVVSRAISLL